jgi:hypothetical protein
MRVPWILGFQEVLRCYVLIKEDSKMCVTIILLGLVKRKFQYVGARVTIKFQWKRVY